MPETIARIGSVLLAGAFGWAALAKLTDLGRWRSVLGRYGLPSLVVAIATPAVPLGELGIAVTTVTVSARGGAIAAIGALVMFSLAIVRARSISGDRLPCGCFGGSAERHYQTMMLRNAGLGTLAAIVLLSRGDLEPALPPVPSTGEVLPALLALAGTILIGWIAWHAATSLRSHDH